MLLHQWTVRTLCSEGEQLQRKGHTVLHIRNVKNRQIHKEESRLVAAWVDVGNWEHDNSGIASLGVMKVFYN